MVCQLYVGQACNEVQCGLETRRRVGPCLAELRAVARPVDGDAQDGCSFAGGPVPDGEGGVFRDRGGRGPPEGALAPVEGESQFPSLGLEEREGMLDAGGVADQYSVI